MENKTEINHQLEVKSEELTSISPEETPQEKQFRFSFLRKYKIIILIIAITVVGAFAGGVYIYLQRQEKKRVEPSIPQTETAKPHGFLSSGRFRVTIPPHAVEENALMQLTPVPTHMLTDDLQGIESIYFWVKGASGNIITTFLKPIILEVTYKDNELKECNLDEKSLAIYMSPSYKSGVVGNGHIRLSSNIDTDINILKAEIDKFPSEEVYFTLAAPLPSELARFLDCYDKDYLKLEGERVIFDSAGYSLWAPQNWRLGQVGAYGGNLRFKISPPINKVEFFYIFTYPNFDHLKLNELDRLEDRYERNVTPIVRRDEVVEKRDEFILGEKNVFFLETSKGDKKIFRYFLIDKVNIIPDTDWESVRIFEIEIPKWEIEITRTNNQLLPIIEEMIKSMVFFKPTTPR